MLFGETTQLIPLTQEKAQQLCDSVFPELAKTTLEITLGDRSTIPLWKQFFFRFENKFLKYSDDKTKYLMANIYEHSKQDLLKLKLFKEREEELNSPEAFSLTRVNSTLNNSNSGNMNTETMTGGRDDKGLMVANSDTMNNEDSTSIDRGASSLPNEDFKNIERSWEKRDVPPTETPKTFTEVKLPSVDEKVNLKELKIGSVSSETKRPTLPPKPELLPEQDEFADVIYTGVTLGKGFNQSKSSSYSAGKTLNNSSVGVSVNKNIMTTTMSDSNTKSMSLEFTKNDTTYQALSLYASNFRESFFNSFSCLFVDLWRGY